MLRKWQPYYMSGQFGIRLGCQTSGLCGRDMHSGGIVSSSEHLGTPAELVGKLRHTL